MNFRESVFQWQRLAGIGRKPRTIQYQAEIAKIILNHWPNHEADTKGITETEISTLAVAVSRYSAPRYNAIVSALRSFVPAARILKRRPVPLKERAMLTQIEFSRLLAELDARPRSHAGLIVRFLAHTGLRINEARQLRWCDVHQNFILLPGRFSKNGRPRHIPFVKGVAETLATLRRVSDGDNVLPAAEVKRSLQTACRLAGLPRLSHHDFRHLFATRCIESSVDIPTVARWLGHSDGGALLGRVYFHLADAHSREMAAKVEIQRSKTALQAF